MQRRIFLAALSASALAGCASERPAQDEANNQAEDVSALENRLEASMSPLVDIVSLGAIRNAGHECDEIAETGERRRHEGALVWTARCANGGEWVVMGNDDGSHRVMTPTEAQALGVPAQPAASGGE